MQKSNVGNEKPNQRYVPKRPKSPEKMERNRIITNEAALQRAWRLGEYAKQL